MKVRREVSVARLAELLEGVCACPSIVARARSAPSLPAFASSLSTNEATEAVIGGWDGVLRVVGPSRLSSFQAARIAAARPELLPLFKRVDWRWLLSRRPGLAHLAPPLEWWEVFVLVRANPELGGRLEVKKGDLK